MKKIILALSIISIFSLSSCTVTKTIIDKNEKSTNESTNDNKIDINIKNSDIEEYYTNNKTDGTIYYFVKSDEYDEYKILEDKVNDINNISLKEVLEKEVELSDHIPKGTIINDVKVENKVAYVDVNLLFSEDPNTNSSYASRFKVYALVNTLCYNKVFGIEKVVFLIDGKETSNISIFSNKNPFEGTTFHNE